MTEKAGLRRVSRAELEALAAAADEVMGRAEVLLAVGMQIMVRLGQDDPEVKRWCVEVLEVLGPPEEILAWMERGAELP